jgi:hypothetical protein
MRPLLRLAGCAALVGLLLIGSCALRPEVFVQLGLDFENMSNSLRERKAASERAEELTRRSEEFAWRKRTMDEICDELIDDRLPLTEATRRFLDLPGTTENIWREIRSAYAGATREESMSRLVIERACALLEQEPARAEALRQRLQAELKRQYCLDD